MTHASFDVLEAKPKGMTRKMSKKMTEREIQVVGDFFATLSPYMIGLLSKPEVQEIAQNTALVKFIQRERVLHSKKV